MKNINQSISTMDLAEDEQDEGDQISDEDDDDEIKDPEIDMAIAKHS